MEIRRLSTEADQERWTDFATKDHSCTLFHQLGWKNIIERAYGYRPYYLLAEQGREVVGILPLFLVRDILWRKALISLPFVPYGGIRCGDANAGEQLLQEARLLREQLGAKYVEMRSFTRDAIRGDDAVDRRHIHSVLRISGDVSSTWQRLNKNRRKKVRKAWNNGLTSEACESSRALPDFYYLYARNMRNLGTPVHSLKFFRQVIHELPGKTRIILVRRQGKSIAGSLLLQDNTHLICGWGASLKEYLCYEPNDLLYWEIVNYACQQGMVEVDFGRSLIGSGSALFKKEWGAEELVLDYRYLLNGVQMTPNISSSNPGYARWAGIWRRLPLAVAGILGPPIRKRVA